MHENLARLKGTVGVWTVSHEFMEPSMVGGAAARAEAAGFRAYWLPEAWGREAMTGASLLLAGSERLTVATGIAQIYARDAMATSAAAKTLYEAYGRRFVLGLGVSHRPLVERARKSSYEPPLAAMSTYLDELAAAPDFAAEGSADVPRVLAALGPKMLALSAAKAHGALSYLATVEHTRGAREVLGDAFLAVEVSCVLDEDRDEFLRRAHDHLNDYTGLDNYRASWRRLGFDDTDFVRGGSERLCDALVAHGDVAGILDVVRTHLAAGADHVCLQVLGASRDELPGAQWDRLGAALTDL